MTCRRRPHSRSTIPYGVDVTDRRLGSSYHNDPWWPEVGAMLREKFGWPPPDFSPLANLGSPSEKKLDGKEAPPLRVATWLNSKPLDLGTLRGKVVLLEFWNVSTPFQRPIVPALRELYSVYHPAGLEIIAVHTPTPRSWTSYAASSGSMVSNTRSPSTRRSLTTGARRPRHTVPGIGPTPS